MKTVDCFDCKNLIPAKFPDENNLVSNVIENPKCKLGKRIKIRIPKSMFESASYPRKCDKIERF